MGDGKHFHWRWTHNRVKVLCVCDKPGGMWGGATSASQSASTTVTMPVASASLPFSLWVPPRGWGVHLESKIGGVFVPFELEVPIDVLPWYFSEHGPAVTRRCFLAFFPG